MQTRYEIVITEVKQEMTLTDTAWEPISQDADGARNFGYTHQIECVKQVTRKIYTQNVDKLDLDAVIRAVNK